MTAAHPRSRDADRVARFAALGCALAALIAALLVCSGSHVPRTVRHIGLSVRPGVSADVRARTPAADLPARVCTSYEHGPGHGSGCSGTDESSADATLPGPPTQPTPAAPPRLPLVGAFLSPGPPGPLPGSDLSPDLHVLQILRA